MKAFGRENGKEYRIVESQKCSYKIFGSPPHDIRITHITSIVKDMGEGLKILDVGCAESAILQCVKNGNVCIGFDRAKFFTNFVHKLGISSVRGDWDNGLPFKDKSFDLVIWSEGPEHTKQPNFVFGEIERVCKRWFITTVPDLESAPEIAKMEGHVSCFTLPLFRKILERHFRIELLYHLEPWWIIAVCELK